MKTIKFRRISVILNCLSIIGCLNLNAQNDDNLIVNFPHGQTWVGMHNYFWAVDNQNISVNIDQLKAIQISVEGDTSELNLNIEEFGFSVFPDNAGQLIIIYSHGKIKETSKWIIGLIKAAPTLGKFRPGKINKAKPGELKAQTGIIAYVNCCGFDARCSVLNYRITRISNTDRSQKVVNHGASFGIESRELINKASDGDTYKFHRIIAKCTEFDPGQLLEDIEIKIEKSR